MPRAEGEAKDGTIARRDGTFRVLGVDPGSHVTGYGVVEKARGGLRHIVHGEIRPRRGATLTVCLQAIYEDLFAVIGNSAPDALVIENIFYGQNVRSLIKQGHCRGVAILAGKLRGVAVYEYSPLEIKKAVVGYGRAEKSQVQMMVKAILNLAELPPPDAADALAVAICHINFGKAESI
ncbi:MAG: crossover junction endodeoxyribonuclease RuvC [Syntrophales bacterium]